MQAVLFEASSFEALNPDSIRTDAESPADCAHEKGPQARAFPQAVDGIRTHDLLLASSCRCSKATCVSAWKRARGRLVVGSALRDLTLFIGGFRTQSGLVATGSTDIRVRRDISACSRSTQRSTAARRSQQQPKSLGRRARIPPPQRLREWGRSLGDEIARRQSGGERGWVGWLRTRLRAPAAGAPLKGARSSKVRGAIPSSAIRKPVASLT